MPFHTIDPLKKNNSYKNIGNRSKNDLNKQKNKISKNYYKNKQKNKQNNDFIIKQSIKELQTLGIIGNSIKAEFPTFEKKTIDTNKNIKKLIEPNITKIQETYSEINYIPHLLII